MSTANLDHEHLDQRLRDDGPHELTDRELQLADELAKSMPREIRDRADPNEIIFDTEKFEQAVRVARTMAHMSIIPRHLTHVRERGGNWVELPEEKKIANCFRVVNQALRWKLDPFSIVDCTYVVNDRLGWEGKLVAAIVNTRAKLDGRLSYQFSGEGNQRTVTISGLVQGEDEPRTVDLVWEKAATKNRDGSHTDQWTRDPDQKLIYSAVTKWARRHTPEVLLGIFTEDDLDRISGSERDRSRKSKYRGNLVSPSTLNDQLAGKTVVAPASRPAETESTEAQDDPSTLAPPHLVNIDADIASALKAGGADGLRQLEGIRQARIDLCRTQKQCDQLLDKIDPATDQLMSKLTDDELVAHEAGKLVAKGVNHE